MSKEAENKKSAVINPVDLTGTKTYFSSCAMECLHHNLTAYVVDDKIVKVEGSGLDESLPCLRGLSRAQWTYHPERLTMPLLRTGVKGENKWREISWDEALDLIIEKLNETLARLGNRGLVMCQGSGNFAELTNGVGSSFFNFLGGTTPITGQLCCEAVTEAMVPIFGNRDEDTRDTFADSKYILSMGNNPAVTMQSFFPNMLKAQKNGAKMVTIDPRYSETAAKSDEWIPIIPGTDTALLLGMIKIIIESKLYDEDFMLKHSTFPVVVDRITGVPALENSEDPTSFLVLDSRTNSLLRHDTSGIAPVLSVKGTEFESGYITQFDMLYEESLPWTPTAVEAETDVPIETVVRLAKEYASMKPSMIIQNMGGLQRTEWGSYAVAAECALAVMTGNVGGRGNGVCDAGGVTHVVPKKAPIESPPVQGTFGNIPITKFGEYVLADRPNEIGFLWIMTTSMMSQFPNLNAVKEALKKIPFVVTVDNLMTSSALHSDLVLPCTTIFECTNLMFSNRSRYVQIMEKAVEPPGEAKSDLWIFTELAKRLGFGEAFDKPIEEHIRTILVPSGITYEDLIQKKCIKPEQIVGYIPYERGNFKTSTGKAHMFNYKWHNNGHHPIVTYKRSAESVKGKPALAAKYPLACVQLKTARTINSSFTPLPWINEVVRDEPHTMIHPEDAAARGIKSGDWIVLFNDRGEHRARANVTTHVKKGIVTAENGWWEQHGGSSSYITNDVPEKLSGGGHCCNNTLVEVRRDDN